MKCWPPTIPGIASMCLVGLCWSLTLPASANDENTTPETSKQADNKPTIIISGDDAELVASVAAELRAAGFDVIILAADAPKTGSDGTLVNIERIGDSVVVHAHRKDGALEAELPRSERADGMTHDDATALRAAEAIRSLVVAPGARAAEADVPDDPATKPATEPDPADAAAERAAVTLLSPEPIAISMPLRTTRGDVLRPREEDILRLPVLRASLFSGGGFLAPFPAMVVGVGLRGQVAPKLNIAGLITGMKDLGHNGPGGDYDVFSARATILASWEILGADNFWTPTLGGGLFGEAREWTGVNERLANVGSGDPSTIFFDGSMIGMGLAATAGISVARPWRFRFDIHADVRVATWEGSGNGQDEFAPEYAPSVLGTFGIEYDLIERAVLRKNTASR